MSNNYYNNKSKSKNSKSLIELMILRIKIFAETDNMDEIIQ